jgi:hypothetical protein
LPIRETLDMGIDIIRDLESTLPRGWHTCTGIRQPASAAVLVRSTPHSEDKEHQLSQIAQTSLRVIPRANAIYPGTLACSLSGI